MKKRGRHFQWKFVWKKSWDYFINGRVRWEDLQISLQYKYYPFGFCFFCSEEERVHSVSDPPNAGLSYNRIRLKSELVLLMRKKQKDVH